MIPREHVLVALLIATTLLNLAQTQNSKSYDTNDWIPITDKCPTCYQNNNKEEHVIEKKASERVLNLAEHELKRNNFFPEEHAYRAKKSSKPLSEQYLREISPPPVNKKLPKRQQQYVAVEQPIEIRALPPDIRQKLNQGEYVNHQYFRQAPPPPPPSPQLPPQPVPPLPSNREPQQFPPQQIRQPQLVHPQLLIPQGQQYFNVPPQPLFDISIPPSLTGVNVYQANYQSLPVNPPQAPITKTKQYETLNPGIQAINHGLSGDITANANINYNDPRQVTLTSTSARPQTEKETVQLVYVPLESLNQQQSQIQKQHNAVFQLNDQVQKQQEQQRKASEQQQQQQQQKVLEEKQKSISNQREEPKAERELVQATSAQEQQLKLQQKDALIQKQIDDEEVQAVLRHLRQRPMLQSRVVPIFATETPLQHRKQQLQSIQNDFAEQALNAFKLQLQLQQQQGQETTVPVYTTTTQAPTSPPAPTLKKRKPHQPPLAVYMETHGDASISDVLDVLKSARTIAVQDSAGPNSPQVFVGPYNLEAPNGYTKFDLPYLSTLETNRVERKVDQLPFFVAPLSYKTPPGYSKIPLPAPHVGSVVVSQKEQLHEKHVREQPPPFKLENLLNEEPYRLPNQPPVQLEQQPRPISQFKLEEAINQSPYRIPSQQSNLDAFSAALVNPTTTKVPVTSRPDLLGQTINQYELEQINSQFVSKEQASLDDTGLSNDYEEVHNARQPSTRKIGKVIHTTPVAPSRVHFVTDPTIEVQTTTKQPETRSRRPTQRTRGSTQSVPDKNRYTVLEEFAVKRRQPSTTSLLDYEEVRSTPSTNSQLYSGNIIQQSLQPHHQAPPQALPDAVSQLSLESLTQTRTHQVPQQVYISQDNSEKKQQQQQQQQQPLALSNIPTPPPLYFQLDSNGQLIPVQNVDESPYRLVNKQAFDQDVEAFRTGGLTSVQPPLQRPVTEPTTLTTIKLTELPVEVSSVRSKSRGNIRSRTRGKSHYVPESQQEEERATPKQDNVENYKLPSQLPSINPGLHTLINDLRDQSIRPLLVPASIAPTTEHHTLHQLQQQEGNEQQSQTSQRHQSQVNQQQQPQIVVQKQQPQILHQHQQQSQFFSQEPQIIQQNQPQQSIYQQPQLQDYQQYLLVQPTEAESLPSTTLPPPPTTTTYRSTTVRQVVETTTPYRRQRGRQRARASTTTTSTPRRSPQRTRKPTTRPKADHYNEDYVDYAPAKAVETGQRHEIDYATESPRKSSFRQRTRSRGARPAQEVTLTERTSTSTSEENAFKEPSYKDSAVAHFAPQSYMQFEQPIQIASQNQVEKHQYQPIYAQEQVAVSSIEPLPLATKEPATEQPKFNVDVLINHPITENVIRESAGALQHDINGAPEIRFSSNIGSHTKLQRPRIEPEQVTTTTRAPRIRTRGRGRSRTKPTTSKPITTTANHIRTTTGKVEEEEEEFYGFIRAPNYNRPPLVQYQQQRQPQEEPKLYSASYVSGTERAIPSQYEDQPTENSNNVQIYSKNTLPSSTPRLQFVGKIKPKYPTETEAPPEITTEVPATTEKLYVVIQTTKPSFSSKPRIRSRVRLTTKKPFTEAAAGTSPASTRTTNHKFKPRGVAQFKLPETIQKQKSEDEDVAGGNYPAPFLQAQEVQTDRPQFQITIDPGLEENLNEDDQLPYSSIHQPKFVPADQNGQSLPLNVIPIERKLVESQEQPSSSPLVSTSTEAVEDSKLSDETKLEDAQNGNEDVDSQKNYSARNEDETQYSSNAANKPKSRRRGIWRLVKRPVDSFETAESQYVGQVVAANSFDTSLKSKTQEKGTVEEKTSTTTPIPPSSSSSTETSSISSAESSSSPSSTSTIEKEDRAEKQVVKQNADDEATSQGEQFVEVTTKQEEQSGSPLISEPIEDSKIVNNPSSTEKHLESTTSTSVAHIDTTATPHTSSQIPENLLKESEPWNLDSVKTSTSTEISHETEICYRGKCVKSSGTKIPKFV